MERTVADIMNRELLYLTEGSRPELARDPILGFGVTAVPVLDEDRRPVGVVALRDLVAGAPPKPLDAPIETVLETTPIGTAARRLAETDYHHLVVVDRDGRAVGMVSALDFLRAMVGVATRHPAAFPAFRAGARRS